jgi:hypothetical protein
MFFLPLPEYMVDRVTAHLGVPDLIRLGQTSRVLRAQIGPILVKRCAERIWRFLRRCRYVSSTRIIIARFRCAGLFPPEVATLGTPLLASLIMSPPALAAADSFLRRIYRQSVLAIRPREDSNLVPRLRADTFLFMYAVQYQPRAVFPSNGNFVTVLRTAAHELVRCVEAIVANGGLRPEMHFPRLVAQYWSAYGGWQSQPLIDRLKDAIHRLMIARTQVPADEPQDSPLMQEFATRIGLLRARMADLGGEAALAEFDQGI